jgi:pimeloyl-ACP methyl ester carboxylesterase
MPYVRNHGTRIHYRTEGAGSALVLQHGSFASLDSWYEHGYVDALKGDHTVVALDARGYGASDSPHDPIAYALESRVGDIVAVLDALCIERAHFYGYSMGGWIGFGVAKHAPSRFRSLAIGGQHPYAQSLSSLRDLASVGVREGAGAFVETMVRSFGEWPEAQKARWLDADFEAYVAAARDRDSLEDVLPTLEVPCLMIVGSEDAACPLAEKAAASIPGGRLEVLLEIDHGGGLKRSDLVVPILRAFIHDIEEQGR